MNDVQQPTIISALEVQLHSLEGLAAITAISKSFK